MRRQLNFQMLGLGEGDGRPVTFKKTFLEAPATLLVTHTLPRFRRLAYTPTAAPRAAPPDGLEVTDGTGGTEGRRRQARHFGH